MKFAVALFSLNLASGSAFVPAFTPLSRSQNLDTVSCRLLPYVTEEAILPTLSVCIEVALSYINYRC
jgi:hypothetical protein